MILDALTLQNFGLYAGLQRIALTPPSSDHPVILFGGLNGSGKTTLLDALQLALYGKLAPCTSREGAYLDFLRRCMHRGMSHDDVSAVEVEFRYRSEGRGLQVRVRRSWRRTGKGVKEELEVFLNNKPDASRAERWQEHIEALLPVRIAHLFFFDGEQIEGFADPQKSAELLRTAIHSLLGLDLVDQLQTDLSVLERRKRKLLLLESELEKVARVEHRIQELEARRDVLLQEQRSAATQSEQATYVLSQLEERFRSQGGTLFERKHELEVREATLTQQIAQQELRLRELSFETAPLLLAQSALDSLYTQAREERGAEEAEILERVLTERDERLLTLLSELETSSAVREKVALRLQEDRLERQSHRHVTRYLHLDEEALGILELLRTSEFERTVAEIQTELAHLEQLRAEKVDVERTMVGIPDQEQIQQLLEDRERWTARHTQLETRRAQAEDELKKLERDLDQERTRYANQLERATRARLEQLGAENELDHMERAQRTLKDFRSRILRVRLDAIEQSILASLRRLLHKETLITRLTIDPTDFTVHLFSGDGHEIAASQLSAGERQMLAVSMLWGLGQASGRELPIVIDTPLGRLDSQHRAHLVQRYFPHASPQVILLSTDEEIEGALYKKLLPSVGHQYRLSYFEDQRATRIMSGYFPERA